MYRKECGMAIYSFYPSVPKGETIVMNGSNPFPHSEVTLYSYGFKPSKVRVFIAVECRGNKKGFFSFGKGPFI
jgi:hypothetical protein